MIRSVALALALFATSTSISAQPANRTPEAFDALLRCRAIASDAERLACFDRAAGALQTAETAGDVVVVDRAQVREARRSAFGFDLDGFRMFERGRPDDAMDEVTTTIARADRGENGWTLTTAEGQIWRQVDGERIGRTPKVGGALRIRKAALGSYMMNIDGAKAVRAKRVK